MSLQRTFIEKCPIMQQNILLHTGPGHAWKLFSAWFSVLPTMKLFRIFRAIFSDSFEDFLKVFLRKTFRKSFKTILDYFPNILNEIIVGQQKITQTTSLVRLDSGRYATKYHFLQWDMIRVHLILVGTLFSLLSLLLVNLNKSPKIFWNCY